MTKLPDPANQLVTAFVEAIQSLETDCVQGVYLTGSLTLGDFHPTKSDIDFLVFCRRLPDAPLVTKLEAIHQGLAKQFPTPDLSGSYLALDSLQTDDSTQIQVLTYHQRRMRYQAFDMAPISLTELKSNAITVYGTYASELPIHLNQHDLTRFLHHNINSYWKAWLNPRVSFVRHALILLFPRLTEWVLLGIARQLYTLQTGKIVSKTEAGLYCLTQVPDPFHAIIREALTIRQDTKTYPLVGSYGIRPSFNRLRRTTACAQYMITLFNTIYADQS